MNDPLSSWRDGNAKQALIDFIGRVCNPSSDDYVKPAERIAVFDNDGTLWSEQPFYFQFLFIIERIKSESINHPHWSNRQPFKAVLENDWETIKEHGLKGIMELAAEALSGTTVDKYQQIAHSWLSTARHPSTGKLFTEMVFKPMLEVLEYLRSSGFKTFIVSGGGIEFVRLFSEAVYGIPPEQVIGSSIVTRYNSNNGTPSLIRLPEINFIDDGDGKPVGINQHIGRRPIAAFGNSDGDMQMLEWVTSRPGASFGMIIHHDDEAREFAYDQHSAAGRLDKALTEAPENGWIVVSMKRDWITVYDSFIEKS